MNKYVWGIIIVIILIILIAVTSSKEEAPPQEAGTSETVSEGMPVPGSEGEGIEDTEVNVEGDVSVGSEGAMVGEGVSAKTVTVTYNGDAFSPSTVTIAKGDSVKFVNTSSGNFSVASNNHPDHTIYPEFDQWKTSARGQKEFTFTFEKVGTWNYHNHMSADLGGTVIVQ